MSRPTTTAQTTARLSSNILHLCSSLRPRSLMRHALEDFGFGISDLSSLFSICQRSVELALENDTDEDNDNNNNPSSSAAPTTPSHVLRYLEHHEISERLEEEIWILNRRIKLVRPKIKNLRGARLEWVARIKWSGFRVEVDSLKCDMEGVKSLIILVLLVVNLEAEMADGRESDVKETRDQLKSTTRTLLHTQNRSVTSPDFHATGRDRIFALQDTILQLSEHMAKYGTIPALAAASATKSSSTPAGKRKKKTSSKSKSSERLKKRRRQHESESDAHSSQYREAAVGVTFRPQRQPASIVDFRVSRPAVVHPSSSSPVPSQQQDVPYPTASPSVAASTSTTVQMPEMPPVTSSFTPPPILQVPSRPPSTNHTPPRSRPSSTVHRPPSRTSSVVQNTPSRPASTNQASPPPPPPSQPSPPPPAPPVSRPSSTVPPIILVHSPDAAVPPQLVSPRSSNSRYAAYVSDEPSPPTSPISPSVAVPTRRPPPPSEAIPHPHPHAPSTSSSAPPPPPPSHPPLTRTGWINGVRATATIREDLESANFISESYALSLPGVVIDPSSFSAGGAPTSTFLSSSTTTSDKHHPPPQSIDMEDGQRYPSIGTVSFRWTDDEHRGRSFTVRCEVVRRVGEPVVVFGRPFLRRRGRYIT
ncbi:hypothetical protein PVAG01_03233 [Phlyctema vagabunda]|uniref:Uncharacterized protein n=1 Tax=Phlyctema vagabunda TaxID=108571 RepID=A0ABR4PTH2_9HELO